MGKRRTKVGKFIRKVSRVLNGKPAKETAETRKKERKEYCGKMGSGCSFEEKRKLGMYAELDIGPDAELRKAQQIKGVKSGNTTETKGVKRGNTTEIKGSKK